MNSPNHTNTTIDSTYVMAVDTWVHVALVGDGNQNVRTFFNGTLTDSVNFAYNFLHNTKLEIGREYSDQGYFTGYDGRKVPVPNAHKALAGMLQNGEACLMKHSLIKWHKKARQEGINFKMVGFIHDEYQVEVIGTEEEAKRLGKKQADCMLETGEELGFKIPTPGSYDIGKNWAETH